MIVSYSGKTIEEQLKSLKDSINLALNTIEASSLQPGASVGTLIVGKGGELKGILDGDTIFLKNINASSLNSGTIDANQIAVVNLDANNITAGHLDASRIDTDSLKSVIGEFGYMTADEAEIRYADIELADVTAANIATMFNRVGLIDTAVISEGHITGHLDSVEINANKITSGQIIAERILLKGTSPEGHSVLYQLNYDPDKQTISSTTLDGDVITERTITADRLVAHAITANEITAENIVGTGGWINLAQGTFNYQSLETGGGISWDGQHLEINADVVTFGPTRRSIEDVDEAVQGAVQLANDLEKIVDDNYDRVFGETTYRYTHDGVTEIVWHDGQLDSYYYKDSGGQNIPVEYASLDKDEDGELIEDKSLLSDINDLESNLGTKASKSDLDDYVTNGDFDAALSQKIDSADVYTRQELDKNMATKAALESLQTLVNLTDEQMKQMGSILTWKDGVLTIGASDFKTRMKLNSAQLAFVDTNGNVISYVAAGGLAIPSEDTNILKFGVYDGDVSAANFRQKWKQSLQFDSITETYDLVFEYIG